MERSTFAQFYDDHFKKIYRFVAIRVTDRAQAEDLVSEIFLKALQAFDRYDPAQSRSSWIYTIARNHLANHFRDSAKMQMTDEEIETLPLPGKSFLEGVLRHEETTALLASLEKLPAEKAHLLRLRFLEELSYEEMAERVGKTAGSLRVATHRALLALREHLTL